jgi:hypothetical protein
MEPLSFKGRRGSGIKGDRCGYLDTSLKPVWDWEKYEYSLRVFGRLTFNPECDPDVWKRYLTKKFGAGAEAVELAIANSTRILPIVLTSHGASAGNNTYWPEMYTNQSIPDPSKPNPYNDSPSPRVFGNVSPMDPQLFLRINDYADQLLSNERSGKYTPVEVAQWLEDYADSAAKYLARADALVDNKKGQEFRRMSVDVAMVVGLGRFFGSKFRAGVLFRIFQKSGDRNALEESLKYYKKARGYWSDLANRARNIYMPDITVGENPVIRGHWLDRLPAIDEDIAFMSEILAQTPELSDKPTAKVLLAINESTGRPTRESRVCNHTIPEGFYPGHSIDIELSFDKAPASACLFYRHVNHAERFQTENMHLEGNRYLGSVPATYTDTQYPIQYYIELKDTGDKAWLYPGFNDDLINQPYFVVRKKIG